MVIDCCMLYDAPPVLIAQSPTLSIYVSIGENGFVYLTDHRSDGLHIDGLGRHLLIPCFLSPTCIIFTRPHW